MRESKYLRLADDFLVRDHMLRMTGFRATNLPEVYGWLKCFRQIDCSEEEFVRKYS